MVESLGLLDAQARQARSQPAPRSLISAEALRVQRGTGSLVLG